MTDANLSVEPNLSVELAADSTMQTKDVLHQ
jgi:hypothetical protein